MSSYLQELTKLEKHKIRILFSDIDDTMTDEGQMHASAYEALWKLQASGIKVVPVTGRPAGWCEMIARFWPVDGIVGENGAFYFRYKDKKMNRFFEVDEELRKVNAKKLEKIQESVLREVPGCAIASDQFCRLMDLAVDFAEDVSPLDDKEISKIVSVFERFGAQAKVSSIHVNGWFGDYNKLSMCKRFVEREYKMSLETENDRFAFSGDSPNDEPMFEFFHNSFAVANIRKFQSRIKHLPRYVANSEGGHGFVEIANRLIDTRE